MVWGRTHRVFKLACVLAALACSGLAWASAYHGQITFGGLPVPGATVTVTQGAETLTSVSDQGGLYDFPNLADGGWKIEIEMQGFSTIDAEITIAANSPEAKWELPLLSVDQMMARSKLKEVPVNPLPSAPVTHIAKPTSAGSSNGESSEIPKQEED